MTQVRLLGLLTSPELNGITGKAVQFDEGADRVVVVLSPDTPQHLMDATKGFLRVRPKCLVVDKDPANLPRKTSEDEPLPAANGHGTETLTRTLSLNATCPDLMEWVTTHLQQGEDTHYEPRRQRWGDLTKPGGPEMMQAAMMCEDIIGDKLLEDVGWVSGEPTEQQKGQAAEFGARKWCKQEKDQSLALKLMLGLLWSESPNAL